MTRRTQFLVALGVVVVTGFFIVVLASAPGSSTSASPASNVTPEPSGLGPPTRSPTIATASNCQNMIHVYHPDRLQVLASCVSLSASVQSIRHEADGDWHVLLQPDAGDLDPRGGRWINGVNVSGEHGYLVAEPVCVGSITQGDAVAACQGYHNPTPLPTVGEHVRVSGPWVLDLDHGWNEIHPAVFASA